MEEKSLVVGLVLSYLFGVLGVLFACAGWKNRYAGWVRKEGEGGPDNFNFECAGCAAFLMSLCGIPLAVIPLSLGVGPALTIPALAIHVLCLVTFFVSWTERRKLVKKYFLEAEDFKRDDERS
jgi:hypothetical protein